MKTSLTRRYHFAASHRLESPELTPAENARIYGKCNNPFGHGHDYTLEVTVTGDPNSETGLILPYRQLDDLVKDKVLQLFANRNINLDVPQFTRLVPTTENMALVIAQILKDAWEEYFPPNPKLSRDREGAVGLNSPMDEATILSENQNPKLSRDCQGAVDSKAPADEAMILSDTQNPKLSHAGNGVDTAGKRSFKPKTQGSDRARQQSDDLKSPADEAAILPGEYYPAEPCSIPKLSRDRQGAVDTHEPDEILSEPKLPTLVRIHIQETGRNGFELQLNQSQAKSFHSRQKEHSLANS